MTRFTVITEKIIGTRTLNYAVKDTATQEVLFRSAYKETAEDVASKANLALAGSEEKCMEI